MYLLLSRGYVFIIIDERIPGCFQIAKLQDDNRALDRLTKQKEAALLEAERTVQIAMAKAALVDDMQNKNQELMKQIEICQVHGVYCILKGLYNKITGQLNYFVGYLTVL